MHIDTWIWIWKGVLLGGIGLFAGLAVVVTIGGYFDIKELFRSLKEDMEREENSD